MRCPCCESPLEHDVRELLARISAPIPSPSVAEIGQHLAVILEREEARHAECELAPGYINLDLYDPSEYPDLPAGSDAR